MSQMKPKKIFYSPHDGSGPLGIYWYDGPYGEAHEAPEQCGSLFLAPNKEILGVIFDDVDENDDHQFLTAPLGEKIEVRTKNGKVDVKVAKLKKHA
jgi:hypothetical protein